MYLLRVNIPRRYKNYKNINQSFKNTEQTLTKLKKAIELQLYDALILHFQKQ